MARRKHHHKKSHRRRIGAMSLSASSPLVKYGSIALGYIAATTINNGIDGIVPSSMKTNTNYGKLAAVGEVGLGAMLAFRKGKKSTIGTIAGGLLIGAGLKRGMAALSSSTTPATTSGYGQVPVVGGYGQVPVVGRRVNGYTPNQTLGGYTPNQTLTGNKPAHLTVMGSAGSGLMRSDG